MQFQKQLSKIVDTGWETVACLALQSVPFVCRRSHLAGIREVSGSTIHLEPEVGHTGRRPDNLLEIKPHSNVLLGNEIADCVIFRPKLRIKIFKSTDPLVKEISREISLKKCRCSEASPVQSRHKPHIKIGSRSEDQDELCWAGEKERACPSPGLSGIRALKPVNPRPKALTVLSGLVSWLSRTSRR